MSRVKVDGACPKRNHAYGTEEEALEVLLEVKIRRGTRPGGRSKENGVYLCRICPHAYHLTSKMPGIVRWIHS